MGITDPLREGKRTDFLSCGQRPVEARRCSMMYTGEHGILVLQLVEATTVQLQLPNGTILDLPAKGTVQLLKEELGTQDFVRPSHAAFDRAGEMVQIRDYKELAVLCDGRLMKDSEELGPLGKMSSLSCVCRVLYRSPGNQLTLQVLRANYDMTGVYDASLRAERTAAPQEVGVHVPGQWPRFDNHCKECTRPLAWMAGDMSGGGRFRRGSFFCKSC